MFLPRPDRTKDAAEWRTFLRSHPFGLLIAPGRGRDLPLLTPSPFVLEPDDTVLLHLATPNPVWDAIAENPLVILAVTADSSYIPGAWKALGDEDPTLGIPTEYYASVHVTARVELLGDPDATLDVLRHTVAAFEPGSGLADPEVHRTKLSAIRAARLHPVDVAAKFKYGGNVDADHRLAVADQLERRDAPGDQAARAALLRRLNSSTESAPVNP